MEYKLISTLLIFISNVVRGKYLLDNKPIRVYN